MLALMFGGGALGAAGSLFGSSGRDARRQRDMFYQTADRPQTAALQALFGFSNAPAAQAQQGYGTGWRQNTDLDALAEYYNVPGGASAIGAFEQMNPGFGPTMNRLAGQQSAGQNDIMGRFDRDTNTVMNLDRMAGGGVSALQQQMLDSAMGTVNDARQWGNNRSDIINRDFDQAGRDLDSRTTAAMRSRGLGNSSLVGTGMAQNAGRMQDERQRALQNNSDATLDRVMGAQGGLTSAFGNAADRTGLQANRTTDIFANRSQQRTGLADAFLGRDIGLQGQTAQTLLNTQLQPVITQSGAPIGQMTPNPTGQALGQLGSLIGGVGAFGLGGGFGGSAGGAAGAGGGGGAGSTGLSPLQMQQMLAMQQFGGGFGRGGGFSPLLY